MRSFEVSMRLLPALWRAPSMPGNGPGPHTLLLRQIKQTSTLSMRRARYCLWRIAGNIVLVAGSWAG
jgi:hypothetical protein